MLNLMRVLETLRPDLVDEVHTRRAKGQSLELIATWLREVTEFPISRESVRMYFKSLGEPVRPRGPNKPKSPIPFAPVEDDPAYDEDVRISSERIEPETPVAIAPEPTPVITPIDETYQKLWNAAREAK